MKLLADVRHVARGLWRDRRSGFWAVLMLALGIGSTAAVFGLVKAVLLQPLPYKSPNRLVVLWQTEMHASQDIIPWGNFLDYQRQTQLFRGVAAFGYWTPVLKTGSGRESLVGAGCTSNLFPLLGISPLLGRMFLPRDQKHGAQTVVVLSYGLWRRDFGSDPKIIGKHVSFDEFGTPVEYTIVGVMPPNFDFPHPLFEQRVDAWTAMQMDATDASRYGNQVYALGRLRPGVSLGEAQTQLSQVAKRLAQEYPSTNRGVGVRLVPLASQLVHNVRPMLLTLSAAVGFILLLSCASVAGLILARSIRRSQESAVRAVLGAETWDLMRPPIIEGLLFAILGGALGMGIAQALLALGLSQIPANLLGPRSGEARVDGTVLACGLGLALICGLGSALAAALRSCRLPVGETLKQGGQSASAGRVSLKPLRAFVMIQIAAAFVLLAGTGLMIRSFLRLDNEKLGFDPKNLLTFSISLPNSFAADEREVPVLNQFLARVRTLPRVASAGLALSFPIGQYLYKFRVDGGSPEWRPASFDPVSPDWFRTLGLRMLTGRGFTEADGPKSSRVMVINQAMARRYWPGENPIGKRITVKPSRWRPSPQYTVIGEVSNIRPFGGGNASPVMFVPFAQFAEPNGSVIVRARTDPRGLIASLRAFTVAIDPAAMAEDFTTAEQMLAHSTQKPRLAAKFLGMLAIIALAIAAVGTYSLVSLVLRLQLRSVGIRLALGAPRRGMVTRFLQSSLRLALIGIALGLIASLSFDRLIRSLLYGLSPADPIALSGAGLVLLAVCLLATLPTALVAANVDPSVILREE